MRASIEDYEPAIPAKTVAAAMSITGSVFAVFAVTGTTLQVRFDNGNWIPVLAGLKLKLPQNDAFNKVTFKNTGNASVTVSFYAGTVDIELTKLT